MNTVKVSARAWQVGLVFPAGKSGKSWATNIKLTALCETAGQAVQMAEGLYPGCTVLSVNHKGAEDIYCFTESVPTEGVVRP